jgi:hypothetical protein
MGRCCVLDLDGRLIGNLHNNSVSVVSSGLYSEKSE